MTVPPEYPHGNRHERWAGNAEVYERHRVTCLETAERMRAEGNSAGAKRFAQPADRRAYAFGGLFRHFVDHLFDVAAHAHTLLTMRAGQ